MITRITLDNYMSHAHTVIEPAAGLTVILGPNNCGKSAIVSALQTLCGDNNGDFMVRHGQTTCQVTVETDDGHTIAWRRIKGKVSYVLDSVEVHRAGAGNLPDDLQTFLRLPKVRYQNGDKEFDIHFGDQKAPVFLIDNQADTAAFFSTASDAEKLLEIQKRHKDKVRDARREHQKITAQTAQLDALLTALSPLDEINLQLDSVEQAQRQLLDEERAAESLSLFIDQIEKQEQIVRFRAAAARAVAPLCPPPELSDLEPLGSLIDRIAGNTRRAQRLREETGVLALTQPPPEQDDTLPLEQHISRLTRAAHTVRLLRARLDSLATLYDPPPPLNTQPLADFVARFELASRSRSAAAIRQNALAFLSEPPALQDPSPLADLIARMTKAATAAAENRRAVADYAQQIAHIDSDMNAWLWAHPTCPTCGATTTRESLFTGAHGLPPRRGGRP